MSDLTLPPSLWRETAIAASPSHALAGAATADVAIIGAGYTGLCAALRAIERGLKPALIEPGEVGFGASGRNGGVVSTKYRVSLSDMARHHSVDLAKRMNRLAHDAMDCVERNVAEHAIHAAGFAMAGNLRCAHNANALMGLSDEARIAMETFGDTSLQILDAAQTRDETGSSAFVGGVLNKHAASSTRSTTPVVWRAPSATAAARSSNARWPSVSTRDRRGSRSSPGRACSARSA